MILDDIQAALETVDDQVFYGAAHNIPTSGPWEYIVFARQSLSHNANITSFTDRIEVVIVRESYVPVEDIYSVMQAMTAIPGVRLAQDDCRFDAIYKPDTDDCVEAVSIPFVHAFKAVCDGKQ